MKIAVNNENIERVPSTKLLGTYIDQNLKWEDICTSCYAKLAMLRKVKSCYNKLISLCYCWVRGGVGTQLPRY